MSILHFCVVVGVGSAGGVGGIGGLIVISSNGGGFVRGVGISLEAISSISSSSFLCLPQAHLHPVHHLPIPPTSSSAA